MRQQLTAILPCTDLDEAQAFFERLGCTLESGPADYRMLANGLGGHVHLTPAAEDVDAVAAAFAGEVIEPEGASDKPWGMYELALNGPDGALARVGWPMRLR